MSTTTAKKEIPAAKAGKGTTPAKKKATKGLVLDFTTPDEIVLPKDALNVHKSGTAMDDIITDRGGFMPGMIILVFGGAGGGKSTGMSEILVRIKENNQDVNVAAVQAEMDRIDTKMTLSDKCHRIGKLPTLFTKDEKYKGKQMQLIEQLFHSGLDYILVDSIKELIKTIRSESGMSERQAEGWLLELMKDGKAGRNATGKMTTYIVIQQVNKGGVFVGSNALQHDVTVVLQYDKDKKTGERYCYIPDKNRRNGAAVGLKLYVTLDEENKELVYDGNRLKQFIEERNRIHAEKVNFFKNRSEIVKMFAVEETK